MRSCHLKKGQMSILSIHVPVSYTQLDVYKRQVYRDSLLQQSDGSYNKANAAYSFGGVEGAVALLNKNLEDVYKRQVRLFTNYLRKSIRIWL